MRIELVLFDLDDVLVEYSHAVRCRVLAERVGSDPRAVHAALFESGLETEADLGRIGPEAQARALSAALGLAVDIDDCVAARAASMTPDLRLLDMVSALQRRGALAILTNNGALIRDHFDTLCPPFAPFFAGRVHCSAMYGIAKPDPEVFLRCAAALGVAPQHVLFIDDKPENALGAERAGMIGHHYREPDALRAHLSRLDLLESVADAS